MNKHFTTIIILAFAILGPSLKAQNSTAKEYIDPDLLKEDYLALGENPSHEQIYNFIMRGSRHWSPLTHQKLLDSTGVDFILFLLDKLDKEPDPLIQSSIYSFVRIKFNQMAVHIPDGQVPVVIDKLLSHWKTGRPILEEFTLGQISVIRDERVKKYLLSKNDSLPDQLKIMLKNADNISSDTPINKESNSAINLDPKRSPTVLDDKSRSSDITTQNQITWLLIILLFFLFISFGIVYKNKFKKHP